MRHAKPWGADTVVKTRGECVRAALFTMPPLRVNPACRRPPLPHSKDPRRRRRWGEEVHHGVGVAPSFGSCVRTCVALELN